MSGRWHHPTRLTPFVKLHERARGVVIAGTSAAAAVFVGRIIAGGMPWFQAIPTWFGAAVMIALAVGTICRPVDER